MFDIVRKILPFKGHKCVGVFHKFEAACECGWYSCPHQTRREAYSEWRTHILDCGGHRLFGITCGFVHDMCYPDFGFSCGDGCHETELPEEHRHRRERRDGL